MQILVPAFCLLIALAVATPAGAQSTVDATTLDGKVLFGYQGWFRTPGDGSNVGWSHWSRGVPSPATITVDLYPDLSEFDEKDLCPIPGEMIGTKPAYLFSSFNKNVVMKHFEWMRTYGLDGVLVQRFLSDIPGSRAQGDGVMKNIIAACERTGRVFAIEYDISGARASTMMEILQKDWTYLVDELHVTSSKRYLRHKGKPVVSVWGMGLNDRSHPPSDTAAALDIIHWFQNTAKATYIGGTPAFWRTLTRDSNSDPGWAAVYQAMDVIQPWSVGRYGDLVGVERWKSENIIPDLAASKQHNQIYMPVIFPGFSWHNLSPRSPQNQIPRLKGEFLWRQAVNARAAGVRVLKIAMFDEVNEGTAMFKAASHRTDAPDQGYWLTLDADGGDLPSDWYLRLASEITKAFHQNKPLSPTMPAVSKKRDS
jgi:hypothetical protein